MKKSILEIFGDIAVRSDLEGVLQGEEERWRVLIEKIAPRYLENLDAGSAENYDHSRFKNAV